MDLSELLLVFAMLWKMTHGLKCYACKSKYDDAIPYHQQVLCDEFDHSKTYYSECENSSMCSKKIILSQFGTLFYERGCAMQTMQDYQELINNRWERVKKVQEVYVEGCVKRSDDLHITNTEYCYCKGDLCNAGWAKTGSAFGIVLSAIWVIVIR